MDERWTVPNLLCLRMEPDDYYKVRGDIVKVAPGHIMLHILDSFVVMVCVLHWLEALRLCPSNRH